jgi:L,D-transpeptidase catalytic domain
VLPASLLQFLRDKGEFMSKGTRMFRLSLGLVSLLVSFSSVCRAEFLSDPSSRVVVSVRDQKLMLVENGKKRAIYPISTSKFGLGDSLGQMTTPLGFLQVVEKIGDNAPTGAVFHNRRWTGEILRPNVPGRDPIVTRIIWLRGLEAENAHAFGRCIYIHGTAEERNIGRPASYGCIRMKSRDVAALYDRIPAGTIVQIVPDRLPAAKTVIASFPAPPIPPWPNDKVILARGDKNHAHHSLIASRGRGA